MCNLAIVIPYYKLTFFRETIQSLVDQTDQRFNVYIGDDASPEEPSALLEEFRGKINFVYYRFEENLGGTSLTKQWERCIEMSQGEEWFMILGDDDILEFNFVEEFYKNYSRFVMKANVIRYATQLINGEGKILSQKYEQPEFENSIDSFFRKIIGKNRGSLSEYIFRKASYEKHLFKNYPLAWFSDDMAVIDFSENMDIISINSSLVYVRTSFLSISGKKDQHKQKTNSGVLFFMDFFSNHHDKIKTEQTLIFFKSFEDNLMGNTNYKLKYFIKYIELSFKYRIFNGYFSLIKSVFYNLIYKN